MINRYTEKVVSPKKNYRIPLRLPRPRMPFVDYYLCFNILLFLSPNGFLTALGANNLINKINYLLFIILLVYKCIEIFSTGKVKWMMFLGMTMYLWLFLMTFLHNEPVMAFLRLATGSLGLMLLVDAALKREFDFYLKFIHWYFTILVACNCILMLLRPSGLTTSIGSNGFVYKMYFLGIDNVFAVYLIPGFCIAMLYLHRFKKYTTRKFIFYVVLYLFAPLFTQTITTLICLTSVIVLVIVSNGNKFIKWIANYRIWFVVIFALFIALNIFGMTIGGDLIQGVLHKDVTYSGRTTLWALAIEMILQYFPGGRGVTESDALFEFNAYSGSYNAHSTYLQYAVYGGIIALVLLLLIIIVSLRKIRGYWKYAEVRSLVLGIAGLLFYYIFETASLGNLFVLLVFVNQTIAVLKKTKGDG